ncbi:MAG: hypothetical protein IH616_02100 [Gemmatimonadales bacterium]|jgi:hypothetical protein|nr:hypothetical protein [Gemmatimonadales bacterium]
MLLSAVAGAFGVESLAGQEVAAVSDTASGPLFASDELIELTIEAPLGRLVKDRGDEKESFPGVVRYMTREGGEVALDVGLRTRGNFRLRPKTCGFPPLRVDVKKSAGRGTLFEGQSRLKLVTHCQDGRAEYEQFVLQEYLIYRIYGLLTPRSFRVRLARITYLDSDGKRDPLTRYGFFVEREEAMAARNGWEVLKVPVVPPDQMQQEDLARFEVFQFFIGNTDFEPFQPAEGAEFCCHNAVLIGSIPDGVVVPVPYDFDWSGVISAPYARPQAILGIRSVRERRYWGVCRPREALDAVFPDFVARRDAIAELVRSQPGLDPKRLERTLEYFGEFYEIIGDARKVTREMEDQCRRG